MAKGLWFNNMKQLFLENKSYTLSHFTALKNLLKECCFLLKKILTCRQSPKNNKHTHTRTYTHTCQHFQTQAHPQKVTSQKGLLVWTLLFSAKNHGKSAALEQEVFWQTIRSTLMIRMMAVSVRGRSDTTQFDEMKDVFPRLPKHTSWLLQPSTNLCSFHLISTEFLKQMVDDFQQKVRILSHGLSEIHTV